MKENYLGKNLKYLRKKSGVNQSQLGVAVNRSHTSIGNWETGFSEPNIADLQKIATFFGITIDSLITSDLSDVQAIEKTNAQNVQPIVQGNVQLTVHPTGRQAVKTVKKGQLAVHPEAANYGTYTPKIITVEPSGKESIVFVPAKARAGYLAGLGDPEFVQELPTANMPGFNDKSYRMFEVEGPSMAPTLESGDKVIGEWVENFDNIRENRVHIVVTHDGIVVKRLLNRISQRGTLVLRSDTIAHRKDYPTYEIDPADVREIWYCRLKVSADFQEPAEIYHRMADMEADMAEVKRILAGIPLPEATMKVRKR